jgi:hypothetical protein
MLYSLELNLTVVAGFPRQSRRAGLRSSHESGTVARHSGVMETTMTQEQKIIRAKVGLLELAKQLGNSLPPRRRGSVKPAG